MKHKPLAVLLLVVQLTCLVLLVITGRILAVHPWLWWELAGLALVGWGVYTMTPRRVTPWPEPRAEARLVTRGPYRWVRHPMYAGLLLLTLALVFDTLTLPRLGIWVVLLIDLLAKLDYEEALLARRFPGYVAYRKRTKRLIPFVY